MNKFLAWLRSLFEKKPAPTVPPTFTVPPVAAPPVQHAEVAKPAIDYGLYVFDQNGNKHTPFSLQLRYQPLPDGWSWPEWAKVAGAVNPLTHDAAGRPIEAQEARQYVSRALLSFESPEALLTIPGRVEVVSQKPFRLSYAHGVQSKGLITAVANGLNVGTGPWEFGPGGYVIDLTGESASSRIAVIVRPA
jgi:hypothetical protein